MKAITYAEYGSPDVLTLQEVATPTPATNEVVIQVHAASVNHGDRYTLRGEPFLLRLTTGLRKPKTGKLGADVAGRVVAVGQNVTHFEVGDEVYGDLSNCGWGAFAEYAVAPEHALAPKPATISFAEAAAVPLTGVTALQGLRDKGHIQAGQQVLINGASGGVGSFAVQIARALGAEVTGVCSTGDVEMVHRLGATHVLDYTQEDYTRNGRQYDLILDMVANYPAGKVKQALKPGGRYVTTAFSPGAMILGPWIKLTERKHMTSMMATPNRADLLWINEYLDAGTVAPVIDRCFPLSEVADALRYLEGGKARGKVVIVVPQGELHDNKDEHTT